VVQQRPVRPDQRVRSGLARNHAVTAAPGTSRPRLSLRASQVASPYKPQFGHWLRLAWFTLYPCITPPLTLSHPVYPRHVNRSWRTGV
jgi:hypothetical protein